MTAKDDKQRLALTVWHRPRPPEVLKEFGEVNEAARLSRVGRVPEAIDKATRALEVIVREEGAVSLRVATAQWNLSVWHNQQKEYDKALALLLPLLDTYRAIR